MNRRRQPGRRSASMIWLVVRYAISQIQRRLSVPSRRRPSRTRNRWTSRRCKERTGGPTGLCLQQANASRSARMRCHRIGSTMGTISHPAVVGDPVGIVARKTEPPSTAALGGSGSHRYGPRDHIDRRLHRAAVKAVTASGNPTPGSGQTDEGLTQDVYPPQKAGAIGDRQRQPVRVDRRRRPARDDLDARRATG